MSVSDQTSCYHVMLHRSVVNKELSQVVSEEFQLSFFFFVVFVYTVFFLISLGTWKTYCSVFLTLLDLKNETNLFKTGQLAGMCYFYLLVADLLSCVSTSSSSVSTLLCAASVGGNTSSNQSSQTSRTNSRTLAPASSSL